MQRGENFEGEAFTIITSTLCLVQEYYSQQARNAILNRGNTSAEFLKGRHRYENWFYTVSRLLSAVTGARSLYLSFCNLLWNPYRSLYETNEARNRFEQDLQATTLDEQKRSFIIKNLYRIDNIDGFYAELLETKSTAKFNQNGFSVNGNPETTPEIYNLNQKDKAFIDKMFSKKAAENSCSLFERFCIFLGLREKPEVVDISKSTENKEPLSGMTGFGLSGNGTVLTTINKWEENKEIEAVKKPVVNLVKQILNYVRNRRFDSTAAGQDAREILGRVLDLGKLAISDGKSLDEMNAEKKRIEQEKATTTDQNRQKELNEQLYKLELSTFGMRLLREVSDQLRNDRGPLRNDQGDATISPLNDGKNKETSASKEKSGVDTSTISVETDETSIEPSPYKDGAKLVEDQTPRTITKTKNITSIKVTLQRLYGVPSYQDILAHSKKPFAGFIDSDLQHFAGYLDKMKLAPLFIEASVLVLSDLTLTQSEFRNAMQLFIEYLEQKTSQGGYGEIEEHLQLYLDDETTLQLAKKFFVDVKKSSDEIKARRPELLISQSGFAIYKNYLAEFEMGIGPSLGTQAHQNHLEKHLDGKRRMLMENGSVNGGDWTTNLYCTMDKLDQQIAPRRRRFGTSIYKRQ
ncbi:unnamed protein product, partial [Mesorhabditis belari]|uniref:Uncharacterized protein n=1 Tax=Mesorhabditis belari TaxID=2138241 RepID=A0AAF3EVM1_9BILA